MEHGFWQKTPLVKAKPITFIFPTPMRLWMNNISLQNAGGNLPWSWQPHYNGDGWGFLVTSIKFSKYKWKPTRNGKKVLLAKGLNFAIGRTSIPCKGYKASFTVYRWTKEEDDRIYLCLVTIWIAIGGPPQQHWNHTDINKLQVNFAHLIEDNDLYLKIARMYIVCRWESKEQK